VYIREENMRPIFNQARSQKASNASTEGLLNNKSSANKKWVEQGRTRREKNAGAMMGYQSKA
jgi:hypothetical protein